MEIFTFGQTDDLAPAWVMGIEVLSSYNPIPGFQVGTVTKTEKKDIK